MVTGSDESSGQAPRLVVLLQSLRAAPAGGTSALLGRCERAALDAALRLRAQLGGTLAVVALVSADHEAPALAAALAAGCDRAVRVHAPGWEELDALGVATVLAAAAGALGCDLLLCGDRGEDAGAVGPAVAELLGVPHLTGVLDLDAGDAPAPAAAATGTPGHVRVAHRSGGRVHRFRWPLPAVLCVLAPAAADPVQVSAQEPDLVSGQAPGRPDRAAAMDGAMETLTLDALGLDARALSHHRLPGEAHTAPGARALLAGSAAELVARLVADGVLR